MGLMNSRWVCFFLLAAAAPLPAATLQVGPGKQYATPCQAFAAAGGGDTIEVDSAGTYTGDVCVITKPNLTVRGVGTGRAHIDAGGKSAEGKAIWVLRSSVINMTVENIEFSGITVPSKNGSGLRVESAGIVIHNCYFHDSDEGILTNDAPISSDTSDIIVENSIFENLGYGDGLSHSIYVNHVRKFVFRGNYSARCRRGNLVKSRASENYILYNRLSQESGTGSWEIDIPNGGLTYIIGNIVEQGPSSENSNMVDYMLEGSTASNPSQQLYVINNTFLNTKQNGTFLNINQAVTSNPIVRNNIFTGPGTVSTFAGTVLGNNYVGDAHFVDSSGLDLRLQPGSPAIDAGINPGIGSGMTLAPTEQYLHPACGAVRTQVAAIDIGAFEAGSNFDTILGPARCGQGATPPPDGNPPPALGEVSVTHGASFQPDYLTAGAIGSMFGSGFSTKSSQATSVPLPSQLDGVSVTFEGITAPLYFVGPTQINFQAPFGLPARTYSVAVRVGQLTKTVNVDLASAAPGIFLSGNDRAIAQNQDYTLNASDNGAAPGEAVIVYLTGIGPLDNAVAEGEAAPASPLSRASFFNAGSASATIGGQGASMLYLGLTPGFVGLAQANLVVPNLLPGDYPIVITIDGHDSNAATMTVK